MTFLLFSLLSSVISLKNAKSRKRGVVIALWDKEINLTSDLILLQYLHFQSMPPILLCVSLHMFEKIQPQMLAKHKSY